MAKKSFSISSDLAQGIRNTISTASQNRGQLNYDLMSIDVIEPDVNNPRKLALTLSDVKQINDPTFTLTGQKKTDYENLMPLVDSIKKVGVRNAVEVYKAGGKYQLISGERRLLASILAAKSRIPAHICDKPDSFNLSYLQWIENIQREDLNLWEKYQNLKQLVGCYQQQRSKIITADVLSELLGVSSRQGYRYYILLNIESTLLDAIRTKQVNNLKILNEIAVIKNDSERRAVIEGIISGNNAKQLLDAAKTKSSTKTKNQLLTQHSGRRGRPAKGVSLGKTENKATAKKLYDMIISHALFKNNLKKLTQVDWSSSKSINTAFNQIIEIVEMQD